MADAKVSALGALTGAGTATGDKIPIDDVSATTLKSITVAQLWIALAALNVQNAYTQTYSTVDRTLANTTAGTLTVTDGAGTNDGTIGAITNNASTITAVQELAAAINALIVDVNDTKQFLNGLVDDLQTLGLIT